MGWGGDGGNRCGDGGSSAAAARRPRRCGVATRAHALLAGALLVCSWESAAAQVDHVYFVTKATQKVMRMGVDGSPPEMFLDLTGDEPFSVAVDEASCSIFVSCGNFPWIKKVTLAGKLVSEFYKSLEEAGSGTVASMFVDKVGRYLYWVQTNNRIMRLPLDTNEIVEEFKWNLTGRGAYEPSIFVRNNGTAPPMIYYTDEAIARAMGEMFAWPLPWDVGSMLVYTDRDYLYKPRHTTYHAPSQRIFWMDMDWDDKWAIASASISSRSAFNTSSKYVDTEAKPGRLLSGLAMNKAGTAMYITDTGRSEVGQVLISNIDSNPTASTGGWSVSLGVASVPQSPVVMEYRSQCYATTLPATATTTSTSSTTTSSPTTTSSTSTSTTTASSTSTSTTTTSSSPTTTSSSTTSTGTTTTSTTTSSRTTTTSTTTSSVTTSTLTTTTITSTTATTSATTTSSTSTLTTSVTAVQTSVPTSAPTTAAPSTTQATTAPTSASTSTQATTASTSALTSSQAATASTSAPPTTSTKAKVVTTAAASTAAPTNVVRTTFEGALQVQVTDSQSLVDGFLTDPSVGQALRQSVANLVQGVDASQVVIKRVYIVARRLALVDVPPDPAASRSLQTSGSAKVEYDVTMPTTEAAAKAITPDSFAQPASSDVVTALNQAFLTSSVPSVQVLAVAPIRPVVKTVPPSTAPSTMTMGGTIVFYATGVTSTQAQAAFLTTCFDTFGLAASELQVTIQELRRRLDDGPRRLAGQWYASWRAELNVTAAARFFMSYENIRAEEAARAAFVDTLTSALVLRNAAKETVVVESLSAPVYTQVTPTSAMASPSKCGEAFCAEGTAPEAHAPADICANALTCPESQRLCCRTKAAAPITGTDDASAASAPAIIGGVMGAMGCLLCSCVVAFVIRKRKIDADLKGGQRKGHVEPYRMSDDQAVNERNVHKFTEERERNVHKFTEEREVEVVAPPSEGPKTPTPSSPGPKSPMPSSPATTRSLRMPSPRAHAPEDLQPEEEEPADPSLAWVKGEWRPYSDGRAMADLITIRSSGRAFHQGAPRRSMDIGRWDEMFLRKDGYAICLGFTKDTELLWVKSGHRPQVWKRVRSAQSYRQGERVSWVRETPEVPRGTSGWVVASDDEQVTVNFGSQVKSMPAGEIIPMDAQSEDERNRACLEALRGLWRMYEEDIIISTVTIGEAGRCTYRGTAHSPDYDLVVANDMVVRSDGWHMPLPDGCPQELYWSHSSGMSNVWERAKGAKEYSVGDVVQWVQGQGNEPEHAGGRVVATTATRVRVKFPTGIVDADPADIMDFEAYTDTTGTSDGTDSPHATTPQSASGRSASPLPEDAQRRVDRIVDSFERGAVAQEAVPESPKDMPQRSNSRKVPTPLESPRRMEVAAPRVATPRREVVEDLPPLPAEDEMPQLPEEKEMPHLPAPGDVFFGSSTPGAFGPRQGLQTPLSQYGGGTPMMGAQSSVPHYWGSTPMGAQTPLSQLPEYRSSSPSPMHAQPAWRSQNWAGSPMGMQTPMSQLPDYGLATPSHGAPVAPTLTDSRSPSETRFAPSPRSEADQRDRRQVLV